MENENLDPYKWYINISLEDYFLTIKNVSNNKQSLGIGIITISIILLSIGSKANIQNQSLGKMDPEIVAIQIGSDTNVLLAVNTFLLNYPKSNQIDVVLVETIEQLFSNILRFPFSDHVIFGHGTPEGLDLTSMVLEWSNLRDFIEDEQENDVVVMACYSGVVSGKKYIGFSDKLDAESAGIISALIFSMDGELEKEEANQLFQIAKNKQFLMKHPLNSYSSETGPYTTLQKHDLGFKTEWRAKAAIYFSRLSILSLEILNQLFNEVGYTITDTGYYFEYYKWWIGEEKFITYPQLRIDVILLGPIWNGYKLLCIDRYAIVFDSNALIKNEPRTQPVIYDIHELWFWVEGDNRQDNNEEHQGYTTYPITPPNAYDKRTPEDIIGVSILFLLYLLSEAKRLNEDAYKYIEVADSIIMYADLLASYQSNPENREYWEFLIIGLIEVSIMSFVLWGLSGGFNIFEEGKGTAAAIVAFVLVGGLLLADLLNLSPASAAAQDEIEDTDNDKIPDGTEVKFGLDPFDADSDNDGMNDGDEVLNRRNPLDPYDPSECTWKNANFNGGSNNFTFTRIGLQNVDRITIYRKIPVATEWGDPLWQFNTSLANEFTETIYVLDTNDNLQEWTDFKFVFERQNNTAGTEWVEQYSEYFYAYDDDFYPVEPADYDGDYLPDYFEQKIGTYDDDIDHDNDGVSDYDEVINYGTNPFQNDTDGDGIDDPIEIASSSYQWPQESYRYLWDSDNDSLPVWIDYDSDNDGLNDSYEDSDKDGVYSFESDISNFNDWDTDDDGFGDQIEIFYSLTDVEDNDTDNDGLIDGWESQNGLNPLQKDSWAYMFADIFELNSDTHWIDNSVYGETRTGGLATTTMYTNYEANEDFVVRVYNSSNDWTLSATERPTIAQYTDGSFYGFVTSWNLTSLRINDPAEAIESATVTLDFYSNTGWDSTDKIKVSLVNLYCNGSYLNDSSTAAHANYSLWLGAYCSLEDIALNTAVDSTRDITTLIDYWYLYSNNTILSLFFYPDPDNEFTQTETIVFDQGTEDPAITITTGDAVLRADSYDSLASSWHGPSVYHTFGCAIDNFTLDLSPYIEASQASEGKLQVILYSGDNGTGTQVFKMEWMDNQTANTDSYLKFFDTGFQKWVSTSSAYQSWYNKTSDNATILRNGSKITFFVDGENETSFIGASTPIRSVVIQFQQYDTTPASPKLGVRSIAFQGHSLDYDDDGWNTTTEHSYGTSIWTTDTDADAMPDAFEVDYTPPLDPTVDDAEEDPDRDTLTNYAEYLNGSDPTVADECLSADILTSSSISKDGSTMTCEMVYNAVGGALYGGGVINVTLYYQYTHYGESVSGWIQFYNGIFWVDTGTGFTFNQDFNYVWQYFDKIDVRWDIYAINGTLHDTYWERLDLGTPSVIINTNPEDTFGSLYNGNMVATIDYYVGAEGYYYYKVIYRTRPYLGTWGDWQLAYADMEVLSVGTAQEVYRTLASYNEWDDFEVKWFFYDNDEDLNLLDSFVYQYLGDSPDALINCSTTCLTQIFDSAYNEQAADYDLYFSVGQVGNYRVVVEYNAGYEWEVLLNSTDEYTVSSNNHLSNTLCDNRYYACEPFDARFTIYTTENIVLSQYTIENYEFEAPASISTASNIVYTNWWDADEECWTPGSCLCVDTEDAGTYSMQSQYKINSTGTYTIFDSGNDTLSLGFNSLGTIYEIANVPTGSTIYVKWEVYDGTGNYLYNSYIENHYYNPASDTDGDEMSDGWEISYGFDPTDDSDADDDPDYDMLTNLEEYVYETDPTYHNVPPDILTASYLTYTYNANKWWLNSYMKVDVNNTGNYNVTVEYKVGAGGTWYTVRNQVMELDTGTNTITDLSLTGVGLSVTCYVRWSIYTEDGEQLYEQYGESKISYGWWP